MKNYISRKEGESVRDCLLRAAKDNRTPAWQAEMLLEDADNPVPMDAGLRGVFLMQDWSADEQPK